MTSGPVDDAAAAAEALLHEGKPKEALEASQRALAADPGNWRAEHVLAQAMIERGQADFALLPLLGLAARRPEDANVQTTLAFAHRLTGDVGAARDALARALAADEGSLVARIELSALHLEAGEAGVAVEALEATGTGGLASPEVQFALARALLASEREDAAREAYARAIAVDPSLERRFLHHAYWFRDNGHEERALRLLDDGLRLRPDDPELAHMRNATLATSSEGRASDAYLKEHFDRFAPVFDTWLQERLHYTAPEQLVARLEQIVGEPAASLDVLDAGCGTGLAGPLLRPFASRLVGVDISQGMLDRAAELSAYDELAAEELTAFLRSRPGRFDVVVAADVLVYFGELEEVIALSADALRPRGIFAFSVERGERPHELRQSGRWAHTPEEVATVCRAAGLEVEVETSELRHEGGQPIAGLICVAVKGPPRGP